MNNLKNRIFYIDFMRVLATLAVVCYHSGTGDISKTIGYQILLLMLNWCVPIFLMITGMLFLSNNKELTEKKMFEKYVFKTIGIILVWGFIYNLIAIVFISKNISLHVILSAIKMVIIADTRYCYQFWYLYMLLGCYLFLPIIKPWVNKYMMDRKANLECYIVFSFFLVVSIIVPSVCRIFGYTGSIFKDAFILFSSFFYYLLCGCWIDKWGLERRFKNIILTITFVQLIWMIYMILQGKFDIIENWYGYTSVFTWCISILIFDYVKQINYKKWNIKIKKLISGLANYSLGVYIFHVMILRSLNKVFIFNNNIFFSIVSVSITILISLIITKIIRLIPGLRKLV